MKTGAALLLALAAVACGRGEAVESGAATEYAPVELRDMEILAEAAGQVEPIRVVEVKSKASGDVLRLHAETGDFVPRTTLLAAIDPRDVRNAYDQAAADLDVAKARLATSQAQKARVEELRRANVVTEQEYESAELDLANARAQYVKASTTLELARERLNDVTIRAPIDGTIISRQVEIGQIIASASQNISGGTTLFMMADLSEMQVRALIDETDLGRIQAGQQARVKVEAFPDRTFIGTVMKIEPMAVVEQNVTMFPVLVRLDNEEGLLRPGMNADVAIEIARRPDALTVPNAAVVGVRDAVPAGAVLGLSEERMQQALRGNAAPAAANGTAVPPGGASGEAGAQRVAAGQAPAAGGQSGGGAAAGGARQGGARQGGGGGQGAGRSRDVQPGVVFVAGPNGPEPRRVMLGLNDWEFTEVVSGLEIGDRVVLISVARLQAQQEQFQQRMRERMGGGPLGGAAPGGRR
jgi:HlyD family secretion protein